MLTAQERQEARQFNQRARQFFWRGILPDTHPVYHLDEESVVDWVLDYQAKNQLKCDGRFGPSTLIAFLANARGGIGGFIIDGKEIHVDGARVARMFTPTDLPTVTPELCCILSVPEIDYATRDRCNGRGTVRAHFSIDSSFGPGNESLIIQWADPMREVSFTPSFDTVDYPRKRQCVGVEVENVLLLYQLDSDERHWGRRRPVVKAQVANKTITQPILYDQQVKALSHLLDVLEKHVGIPRKFPIVNGVYHTDLFESLDGYKGCLAKFNYFQMNNEPGAGFVDRLETLFGKLETGAPSGEKKIEVEGEKSPDPIAVPSLERFNARREELSKKPEPTSSFVPVHEDGPRFSLSNAIAAAYGSGKAGRASRIAEKCTKIDRE